MLFVELLGTLSIRGDAGPVPLAARQKRPLGLIAILALGGRPGLARQRIEGYLWPESTASRARHALDQAVYTVRHAVGSDVILSRGHELVLNPDQVRVDVWTFDAAIAAKDWVLAAGHGAGPLLQGFHVGDSHELEAWIDAERARLLRDYQTAVGQLANRASAAGDLSSSVTWLRRLAGTDPLSAGHARALMLALAGAGDRAGAVKHARDYQRLVRTELEMEPEAEIERLAITLSTPDPAAPTAPAERIVAAVAAHSMATSAAPIGIGSAPPYRRSGLRTLATMSAVAMLAIVTLMLLSARGGGAPIASPPLPAARQAYLHGVAAWDARTKEALDEAVVHFRRATQLDPQYAEAHAGLAEAYVRIGYFGYRPADAMFPKAKAAALRSLQLDSNVSAAHTALATELTWEHDFARAELAYRRAIALDPGNATAHQWHGVMLMVLGRKPEAVVEERRAAALDPLSLQIQNNYGAFLNCSGDFAASLRQFQRAVGEEPDSAWVRRNPWVLANMARAYANNGQHATGLRLMERALEINPRSPRALHTIATIHQEMGRDDLARLAFARADTANEQYPAYRGMLYAGAGDRDSAYLWLERVPRWAIQPMLTLQCERRIDPMRVEPRFLALLARQTRSVR